MFAKILTRAHPDLGRFRGSFGVCPTIIRTGRPGGTCR